MRGVGPDMALRDARARAADLLPDGRAIVQTVAPFEWTPGGQLGTWLVDTLLGLLAIDRESRTDEPGLIELRSDGCAERWSLAHMNGWLEQRDDRRVVDVLADLIDELRDQHVRTATPKLSLDRDPFCTAEDDGVLRFVRGDAPAWSTARLGSAARSSGVSACSTHRPARRVRQNSEDNSSLR